MDSNACCGRIDGVKADLWRIDSPAFSRSQNLLSYQWHWWNPTFRRQLKDEEIVEVANLLHNIQGLKPQPFVRDRWDMVVE